MKRSYLLRATLERPLCPSLADILAHNVLKLGTTPLFTRHSIEWDTDVLFKKPWTLSKKTELMVGIAPEWVRRKQFGVKQNSFAGEFALDLMYWPGSTHKFGWFIEPSYEYTFGREHERSIGVSWGLLIAIP